MPTKNEAPAARGHVNKVEQALENIIFASRWIQAPLYAGLIAAGVIYAWKFLEHLLHMVHDIQSLTETQVMLGVLTLVDITMVANLLTMVIIGGYATFVSRLDLTGHPDRPDWLEHIDAGTMKVKLAGSLVGVSGIHLLQTFINVPRPGKRRPAGRGQVAGDHPRGLPAQQHHAGLHREDPSQQSPLKERPMATWLKIWNFLWHLITGLESVAFVLAALLFVLAWAWGKNGIKKLSKKREAQLWQATGTLVLLKLALMAFTVSVQVFFYLKN